LKTDLILALDLDSYEEAKKWVNKLYPTVKIFKVGIQLFTSCGPKIIDFINKKGGQVFLDLKFFDIPNTVANAVKEAVRLNVKMITLHISGGQEMLRSAVKAASQEAAAIKKKRPLIIGVTVLTSKDTKLSGVLALAKIGIESGLDGVVCSAREAAFLRENIKRVFLIVTPGIRPEGVSANDQKRVATASQARKAGSNYIVVGRPILKAENPLDMAKRLLKELN
jgi:orotidine-5'-phosphate decarboxylase